MRRQLYAWASAALLMMVAGCSEHPSRPSNHEPKQATDRATPDPATPAADAEGEPRASEPASGVAPTIVVSAETIEVAGTTRSYVLAVPSTYSATRPYPLVLAFHGDGGDGAGLRSVLQFEGRSGQDAIVVYPSGVGQTWDLYEPAAQNADVDFVTSLVDTLHGRMSIVADHVFGIGFSNGAFMINQLACRRPGLFRGIASISGGAPSEPRDSTATRWDNGYVRCPGQALGGGPAVLVVHGKIDDVVSYGSGDYTASYWAYVNGCDGERTEAWPIAPCVAHVACPAGHSVLFCPIDGLGHTIWSDATRAAWTFFRAL